MSRWLALGLFYCLVYVGMGVSVPFMPAWFGSQGLTGAQIGLILSAPMLARTVSGPLIALWADGFRLRRTPIMLLAVGATFAYASLALVDGFWFWFLAWFIATSLFATLPPLIDVLGLRRARLDGFEFGWPRGLGSVAFILGNLVMGYLLTRLSKDAVLIWTITAALATALAARVLLPGDPVAEAGPRLGSLDRWKGLGDLLKRPLFLWSITASGLIQAAHAFYYGFSTLIWQAQGLSAATIGMLWGFGVAAEVAFMWFAEGWRRRLGPETMLVLGSLGAIVRWVAMAFSPPIPVLFALQALHAFSFAATFMAVLPLIERYSPPRAASAAQVLNSALSGGLLIGLAMILSGPLFDAFGARGYLAMALIAAIGFAAAIQVLRQGRSAPQGL
jgi:PPP family 3-phenylpropionic acid transporter